MDIAKNLRRLRILNGATQENLAKFLGISFQAVSKWERGEGYPDITLLPAIARFFKITVDELIGTDKALRDQKFKELRETFYSKLNAIAPAAASLSEQGAGGPPADEELEKAKEAAAEVVRAGIREFPDDFEILNFCAMSLGFNIDDKYQREAIVVYEHIIRTCTNSYWRTWAEFQFAQLLAKIGEYDHAYAIAESMPDFNTTKNYVKTAVTFGRGDEHVRELQNAIIMTCYNICTLMRTLAFAQSGAEAPGKAGTDVFNIDEKLEIFDIMFNLQESLYGNMLTEYSVDTFQFRSMFSYMAMAEGRHEKALEYIEKLVEFVTAEKEPVAVLADRLDHSRLWDVSAPDSPNRQRARHCQMVLTNLTQNAQPFEPISEHPRYLAAVDKLKQHAGSDNS